jgi:hypothetical protein
MCGGEVYIFPMRGMPTAVTMRVEGTPKMR